MTIRIRNSATDTTTIVTTAAATVSSAAATAAATTITITVDVARSCQSRLLIIYNM